MKVLTCQHIHMGVVYPKGSVVVKLPLPIQDKCLSEDYVETDVTPEVKVKAKAKVKPKPKSKGNQS